MWYYNGAHQHPNRKLLKGTVVVYIYIYHVYICPINISDMTLKFVFLGLVTTSNFDSCPSGRVGRFWCIVNFCSETARVTPVPTVQVARVMDTEVCGTQTDSVTPFGDRLVLSSSMHLGRSLEFGVYANNSCCASHIYIWSFCTI